MDLLHHQKTFHNGFIGNWRVNSTDLFLGTDSLERYQSNLNSQPKTWAYRDMSISYMYNENGHRSSDLDSVTSSKYMLFTGCSHTFGTGIPLEYTYPHLLSDFFNTKYYNLAMNATGDDTMLYNLTVWRSKIAREPALLVLQWSFIARTLSLDTKNCFSPLGPWTENRNYHEFVEYGERINHFITRRMMIRKQIHALFKCPIVEIIPRTFFDPATQSAFHDKSPDIILDFEDQARDFSHGGIKTNHTWFAKIKSHAQSVL